MRSSKNKVNNAGGKLLLCLAAFAVLIAVCVMGTQLEQELQMQEQEHLANENSQGETVYLFPLTDADCSVSGDNGTLISLEKAADPLTDTVLIDRGGTYILEGSLEGSILVDAQDQLVHLIFQGVDISSKNGSALAVRSAGKAVITLADGTVSTLRDTSDYDKAADENSCIYSECDLTINGTGSMNVHGYYKDAIHTKDTLKILDCSLVLQAKREAARGNDGMLLKDASVDIQCENTGLYTKNDGRNNRGCIQITGSQVGIIAGEYGIAAAVDLHIQDSEVHLKGIISDMEVLGTAYIEDGALKEQAFTEGEALP